MNVHLTGHHVEVTPALREYVVAKMDRVRRHFDHVIDVNVVFQIEKLERKVEATIRVRGKEIFAESRHTDMYAAIDTLIDRLDRQIVKHKEKLAGTRGEPAKHQTAN